MPAKKKSTRSARAKVPSALPPPPEPAARPAPASRAWWWLALGALALVAYFASRSRGAERGHTTTLDAAPSRPVVRVADGPARAGEIVRSLIALPLPEGAFTAEDCIRQFEGWRFVGRDLEAVDSFARWAGVSAQQVSRMRSLARCDGDGCTVMPDVELLRSLSPAARSALYRELARSSENRLQMFAAYRPRELGSWEQMAGLSPRVRAALTAGLWIDGDRFAFSDLPWLCTTVETDRERVEALRALRVRYSIDASVRAPAGDVEPLVRYWSTGSDPDEIRRVLLDAQRRGTTVPVSALLPAMARARLNQYPRSGDVEYDCFWSAANFFEGPSPSTHLLGLAGINTLLRDHYSEVPAGAARMGDVAVFRGAGGRLAHTANFIAEDLLFSKNGRSHRRPWALVSLDDLYREYPHTEVRYFRLR